MESHMESGTHELVFFGTYQKTIRTKKTIWRFLHIFHGISTFQKKRRAYQKNNLVGNPIYIGILLPCPQNHRFWRYSGPISYDYRTSPQIVFLVRLDLDGSGSSRKLQLILGVPGK